MDFKVFTLIGLGLTLTPTLITIDIHAAQAQPSCRSIRDCPGRYNGSWYGPGRRPPDEFIKQGDADKAEGNYDRARENYSRALDLARQNRDLDSQTSAQSRLKELSTPSQLQNNNSLQLQNQLQR